MCLLCTTAHADQVARVIDGDTVEMQDGTKVRLAGIDAPEVAQPYGLASQQSLERLLRDKPVELQVIGRDGYSRVVADVVVQLPDGRTASAAATQVARGNAWFYVKYPGRDKRLQGLAATAHSRRVGLWADTQAIAPWEWRKGKRPTVRMYAPAVRELFTPSEGGCPNGMCPRQR